MMKPILVARDIVLKVVVFKPCQSFSFSFNSKGSRPNHSNELVRYNIYGFSQKKPSFYSSKLDFLSSQLKRLRDQHQEIQAKINQAIVQKKNIDKQLDSENLMMSKLKRYLNDNLNPSPQNMQQLRQKQQAIDSLKMKIEAVERTVKELKNAQEQLKKKEREFTKNDDPQKSKWQLWFGLGGLLATFVTLYETDYFGKKGTYYYERQDKQTKISKEDQALVRYSTNNFDQALKNYVQGSPIQIQLNELISKAKQKRILFIAGCPGVGKSTSMKHLIKKHRENQNKKGKQEDDKKEITDLYYYIDLNYVRNNPEKIKDLQNLLSGIQKKCESLQAADKTSIKLIIDDINAISSMGQFSRIISTVTNLNTAKYLQVVCISSSSRFIQQLSENDDYSFIQKRSEFHVLQDLIGQDFNKFVEDVLVKYYPKITASAKARIIKNKDSLRDVIVFQSDFQNLQTEKQQLDFLESNEKKTYLKHQNACSLIFTDQRNLEPVRMLVEKIINSQEKLQIDKCARLFKEIRNSKSGQEKLIAQIIDQLDSRNMITFCRPRSEAKKNVLRNFLKQFNEKKGKESK